MTTRDQEEFSTFQYEAVSPTGARIKGRSARMVAQSEEAVLRELLAQGLYPVYIKKVSTTGLNYDVGKLFKKEGGPKLKAGPLAAVTRQLHELLKAGIAIPEVCATIAEDAGSEKLKAMWRDVEFRVNQGLPLSKALAAYPRAFDEIYRAYIAAGEATGTLVDATRRLAELVEQRYRMRTKVASVTMYPALISVVIALLVAGIILFLVPQFEEIYASFGAELPAPTLLLVEISRKAPFIMAALAALAFAARVWLRRASKKPTVGRAVDRIKFKIPVVGKLLHQLALYRWVSAMSAALGAGLQQSRALELASKTSGSRWLASLLPEMAESVASGNPLSEQLAKAPQMFPPAVRTMVVTGELAGELPHMLEVAAGTISNQIDGMVATMGAKLEVALLVLMGGVVGGMIIILYLPIINLAVTAAGGM